MLRIGDSHGHVNPVKGIGPRKLAKRFVESGGWLYGLVNLLSWSLGVEVRGADDYRRLYDATVRAAEEMRREGLVVPVILGPHPAETAKLIARGVPPRKAVEVSVEAYRIAAKYVEKGLAHGLGEVGRPHWPAPREQVEACDEVTRHVIRLAAELDVPVHLHTERSEEALAFVSKLARELGLRKVVAHHIGGELGRVALQLGMIPSVPAKANELASSAGILRHAVVESDFLDDPRRPGAVVAPWSIGRTIRRLLERGVIDEEDALRALVLNPARLYSVAAPFKSP